MKKKQFLLAFLFLSFHFFKAQTNNDIGVKKIDNFIVPTTPESYSLFKATDFPVDYRTGKLNIQVPIYNIQVDNLNIPIQLSYNTGGIKVDEISSVLGLGWSLGIPNTITVEQHGKEDLGTNSGGVWFPKNSSTYNYIIFSSLTEPVKSKFYNLWEQNSMLDTQPDIYHYNLPTISGSFFRASDGNFHTIPNENVAISYSNNSFTIIDPQGIKYSFSKRSNIARQNAATLLSEVNTTTYFLTSINLPSGKVITLEYDKTIRHKNNSYSNNLRFPLNKVLLDFGNSITFSGDLCANKFKTVNSTTTNSFTDLLITKISFPAGSVEFNYTDTINGSIGRKDINGTTGYSFALDNIKVFSNNTVVANFKTNLDYFTANFGGSSSIIYSPYQGYRLKLKGVKNLLDNSEYAFEYIENNLPVLNGYSKDLWGYNNGMNNTHTAIYPKLYTIPESAQGADRSVNELAAQAFILKKINYPTKGSSSFEYESNRIWEESLLPTIDRELMVETQAAFHNETEFNITENSPEFYLSYNTTNPSDSISYFLDFGNTCLNNTPPGTPESIQLSNGNGYLQELQSNGTWKTLSQYFRDTQGNSLEIPRYIKKVINGTVQTVPFHDPLKKKRLKVLLQRNEPNEYCSVSISITKQTMSKKLIEQEAMVGGLRIKSISDFDGTNTYKKRTFDYNNPYDSLHKPSSRFTSPLKFIKILEDRYHKKVMAELNDPDGDGIQNGIPVYINPEPCYGMEISDNQSEVTGIFGNDVVNYQYVTEKILGKGKTVYEFEKNGRDLDIYNPDALWDPYVFINKNPISIKRYNDADVLVEKDSLIYRTNYLKNSLSIDKIDNVQEQIASSTTFELLNYCNTIDCSFVDFFIKPTTVNFIKGGKLFLTKQIKTQYFSNGNSQGETNNTYYDTDINKPINLKSTENISSSGEAIKTTYSYAHEKGNQLMIEKNMIGIPLETVSTQTIGSAVKTLSKTSTTYPVSQTEANTKTSGLVLPTSVLSYDLQNLSTARTEVSYDKYDAKGNILQYTTKDGVPVAIVWGYNNTQPIAKVEGATYDQLVSLGVVTAIVDASNADALNPAQEGALITALDTFRKNTGLSGYQISTYTYNPLIGVTSITPPSGIRESYIYDTANRLEKVVDVNGNVLKEMKYNYKN
ncbi:hypothetical protein [Chryseobacterium flavum]|uniref:hypothetical protein n=1 Tax=Chryseobacterium flavum TaxID=415851 RepID=UPI002FD8C680